jgi:hypothetical protein
MKSIEELKAEKAELEAKKVAIDKEILSQKKLAKENVLKAHKAYCHTLGMGELRYLALPALKGGEKRDKEQDEITAQVYKERLAAETGLPLGFEPRDGAQCKECKKYFNAMLIDQNFCSWKCFDSWWLDIFY